MIVSFSDLRTILQWRMTSSAHFSIANSVLRDRFRQLLKPFVSDVPGFVAALRDHGAVISGSLALYYFLPCDNWYPNDMDVYVSHDMFPGFIRAIESHPTLRFVGSTRSADSAVGASFSLDVSEVRKYVTPLNRSVDVIRSRRNNPASPLLGFWTSLLVNYVAPDSVASAFPRMVFNGKGYVKEFGMTSRDDAAMRKYMARKFRGDEFFSFVPELWGTWMDPFYWRKDFFSQRDALVLDLRTNLRDPVPSMPIVLLTDGWKLALPFPARGYLYWFSTLTTC